MVRTKWYLHEGKRSKTGVSTPLCLLRGGPAPRILSSASVRDGLQGGLISVEMIACF